MPYKSEIKITSQQIERIFKGIWLDESITSITEIHESFINPVFDVIISSGVHFILKINNPTWPLKQYREKSALELVGNRTSMPIPKIIEADFSKTLIPYDYMILEKVNGFNLQDCLKQNRITKTEFLNILHSLGYYMGELHQITFDFFGDFTSGVQNIPQKHLQSSGPFWGVTFNTWREAFVALCYDNLHWVDSKSFPKYRKELKKLIEKYSLQLCDQSKGVLIHSDLQPTNILIDNGKISAIIDFEWSYAGSPSFEMALTQAGLFYSTFPSLDNSHLSTLFNLSLEQISNALGEGYVESNQEILSEEHPKIAVLIWLLYMIGSWSWIKLSSSVEEITRYEDDIEKIYHQLLSPSL